MDMMNAAEEKYQHVQTKVHNMNLGFVDAHPDDRMTIKACFLATAHDQEVGVLVEITKHTSFFWFLGPQILNCAFHCNDY